MNAIKEMKMTASTTSKTKDLIFNASLLSFHAGMWNARKKLPQVIRETAENHKADADMLGASKKLLRSKKLTEIRQTIVAARDIYHRYTSPWLDGSRIILGSTLDKCEQEINEKIEIFRYQVESWLPLYLDEVTEAQQSLGSLFDSNDYPTVERLKEKFYIEVTPSPLPNPDDWRLNNITTNQMSIAKQRYEKMFERQIGGVINSVLERMKKQVQKTFFRLSGLDNDGNKTETGRVIIYDDMVEKIEDMLDLLPMLNVIDDPRIQEFSVEIRRKLCTFQPDQLRSDESYQELVRQDAKKIVEEIDEYASEFSHMECYI